MNSVVETVSMLGLRQRRRLERDLHDGAQQRLVSLALTLRMAREKLGPDAGEAGRLLDRSRQELDEALKELRELARGIHPTVLSDRGLGAAVEALAHRAPLPVEVGELPAQELPEQVELAAYFVVSEALTNVAKYASATQASVTMTKSNGRLAVEISDDGVGGLTSISAPAYAVSPTAWPRSRASSWSTPNPGAERPCAPASHARSPPHGVSTGITPPRPDARRARPCPTGVGLKDPCRCHDTQRPSPVAGRDDQGHARVSAPGSVHCAPADVHRQLALAPGHELTEALSAKHPPGVPYYQRPGAGPRAVGGTPDPGAERVPQVSGVHHERQWCRRQIADWNGARRPTSSTLSAPAAQHVKPIQLRPIAASAVHIVRVPVPRVKAITPAVAIELVKSPTAVDQVPAGPSSQHVVARLSPQQVVTRAARQRVLVDASEEPVATGAAVEGVLTALAPEAVVPRVAEECATSTVEHAIHAEIVRTATAVGHGRQIRCENVVPITEHRLE
jgi:histidine kinase